MTDSLPAPNLDKSTPKDGSAPPENVLGLLLGYKGEAEEARKSGPNARDAVWDANMDLYWGRFDFSKKADWQAREVMPEAPVFVDRWAAAMSEALTSSDEWFTAVVPGDKEGDLTSAIVRFMEVHLSRCGRNQMGQPIAFPAVFEEQMKLGAIMAACASVTWKQDGDRGYVSVETFDPRSLWLDPKGRGLYRIRRMEIDLHDLVKLAKLRDGAGKPIYNLEEINNLASSVSEQMQIDLRASSGHGQDTSSLRKPIVLHEYLATVLDADGQMTGENQLIVVANDLVIIRGPETNPFWHKRDWMVYAPLITVPLAPYGKSYMENWAGLARAFVSMTNLILDATRAAAFNAFAGDVSRLEDPTQLSEGVTPQMFLQLEEGATAADFITKLELGRVAPEVIAIWQGIKKELQEGASQSEIALGQFPKKSRITAKEIEGAEQGSDALTASMSRTVEGRFLEPQLDLIWRTALQHMDPNDEEMARIVGVEMYAAIFAQRRQLAESNVSFPVRGITAVIQRGQELQKLLGALQVVGQSEIMTQEMFKEIPPSSLFRQLFKLFGVDISEFEATERDRALEGLTTPSQPQGAPQPVGP